MLLPFLYTLRAFKIPVGTQEWVCLMEALMQDLNETSLDKFYYLARSILVKSENLYDAYDNAFLVCFKEKQGDFEIKKELEDWLNKTLDPASRPKLPDIPPLSLDELRKRFLERLKEQMEEHHGGSHWVGTGGTSPFGHSGAHPSGIRIGGPGGGRMAVKVAEERRFQNLRHDKTLDVRQFKVALKRLRNLARLGSPDQLSLDKSIEATCKNAGDIELVFEADKKNQTELILLMDIGGSMDPHSHLMESLFSAAHQIKHFKTFKHFYFHNCFYSNVYTDASLNKKVLLEEIFNTYKKHFRVLIVGDACMNPYELFTPGGTINYWEYDSSPGIEWLNKWKDHFPKTVWLNPEPEGFWGHVTISAIKKVFQMKSFTVEGLTEAINLLKM